MTDPIVLIPSRLGSTRLPNKPLALIQGEPMIVHVWRRAVAAAVGPVIVAAAESEIAAVIEAAGGVAILTRADHPSGSDRIAEALRRLDGARHHDVVVNVQGDLPTLSPDAIRAALVPLNDPEVAVATLVAPLSDLDERNDPNVVKAAIAFHGRGRVGRALYFSRSPVPWGEGPLWHHIGLYAYRRLALEQFVAHPPGAIERRERLEQLRALEMGLRIDAARVDEVPLGVDTPADLERAATLLARP